MCDKVLIIPLIEVASPMAHHQSSAHFNCTSIAHMRFRSKQIDFSVHYSKVCWIESIACIRNVKTMLLTNGMENDIDQQLNIIIIIIRGYARVLLRFDRGGHRSDLQRRQWRFFFGYCSDSILFLPNKNFKIYLEELYNSWFFLVRRKKSISYKCWFELKTKEFLEFFRNMRLNQSKFARPSCRSRSTVSKILWCWRQRMRTNAEK